MSMSQCQRYHRRHGNESKNKSNARSKPEIINANGTKPTHDPATMSFVKSTPEFIHLIVAAPTHYATRLARDASEFRAAQIPFCRDF